MTGSENILKLIAISRHYKFELTSLQSPDS